jgi:hypothetical protein
MRAASLAQVHNSTLKLVASTYGVDGMALQESRIIADFQAGCPTASGFESLFV